jgi:hypothetical protein
VSAKCTAGCVRMRLTGGSRPAPAAPKSRSCCRRANAESGHTRQRARAAGLSACSSRLQRAAPAVSCCSSASLHVCVGQAREQSAGDACVRMLQTAN